MEELQIRGNLIMELNADKNILAREISENNKEIIMLKETNSSLVKKASNLTELDVWLQNNGFQALNRNFAYKDKRANMDVTVNEFITPTAYEVVKYRNNLKLHESYLYSRAKVIGDTMVKDFVWKSDESLFNSLDYYMYPKELITSRLGDCEDFCLVASSLDPNIGIGYGFWKTTGHAFSLFVHDDELYVLETNFGETHKLHNSCQIFKYEGQNTYDLHWIFTPYYTYQFKKRNAVHFGQIAGWI